MAGFYRGLTSCSDRAPGDRQCNTTSSPQMQRLMERAQIIQIREESKQRVREDWGAEHKKGY